MARALAYSLVLFICFVASSGVSALSELGVDEGTIKKRGERAERAHLPILLAQQSQITMSLYERVSSGMTYDEVVRILGRRGQELTRNDLAGITTIMYMWQNRDGGNMNVMFQNGRVVQRAQFGLR